MQRYPIKWQKTLNAQLGATGYIHKCRHPPRMYSHPPFMDVIIQP
ncbi:hypothetical protein RDI58_010756 [Solanum bulbocastanum]|uniref:Uncharacterized protein n=1 Tax=Solanum bulbocastanum TaxID=147425 RepID=A0AAN8TPV7_SOLBU